MRYVGYSPANINTLDSYTGLQQQRRYVSFSRLTVDFFGDPRAMCGGLVEVFESLGCPRCRRSESVSALCPLP